MKSSKTNLNFGVCLALITLICLSCTNEQITKYTEDAIKETSVLQKLDKVCSSVSLPNDFKLVRKDGIDDQKITLAYYYNSDTSYQETWKLIKEYFEAKGWKLVKDEDGTISTTKILEFTNEEYLFNIQYGGMRSAEYGIGCEKLK
ncbi:MAG TPA: hypothetical protein PKE69_25380 [Pyrinomonadaceae bacterium]|nr:hypothetical protein [Pyrinomonadaceae bacterium]